MLKLKLLASALGCLGLMATSAIAQDADWDKLVAAAKAEGTVSFYGALSGAEEEAIVKNFEAEYGIKVDWFQGRASVLTNRVQSEQAAGRYTADVIQTSRSTLETMAKNDQIVPLDATLPNAAKLNDSATAWDYALPSVIFAYAILVNTDLVNADNEPKSWKDVLDPQWKGKVIMDDPTAGGAGLTFFAATDQAVGDDFVKGLAAADYDRTVSNREAEMQVARGEYAMYFPQMLPFALPLMDLPVKWVVPAEGASYVEFDSAVAKNAAHPNAARLLINYFLDAKSQKTYADGGYFPVTDGVEVDQKIRDLLPKKLMGTLANKDAAPMAKLASEVFGKK